MRRAGGEGVHVAYDGGGADPFSLQFNARQTLKRH